MKRQRSKRTIEENDDAVSITTGYLLNIAIATLLIGALVVLAQGTLTDVRESSADPQMRTLGHDIASKLVTADRIATNSPASNFTLNFELPDRIAEQSYTVEIKKDNGPDTGQVIVRSDVGSGRSVVVEYNTQIETQDIEFASGREIIIKYDNGPPIKIEKK